MSDNWFTRYEKVSLENEIARKDITDNNYKPFGIYYYWDEEIYDVEWFDSENERDAIYEKMEMNDGERI